MLLVIYTCLDTIIERTTSNARHTIGDGDGGKARATIERTTSNARHTIGDGDGGKARAQPERTTCNARHTIGDGDRGEAIAITERNISNARHGILNTLISNLLWYYNTASVFIRIFCYFCLLNL